MTMYRLALPLMTLLLLSVPVLAAQQEVLEIEVAGMTCAFCAYGIEKNLGKLPGVLLAQVNLESKKARVVMEPGKTADETAIREVITEAGFTPTQSTRYTRDQ